MKNIVKLFTILTIAVLSFIQFSCTQSPSLNALVLTGQNNHNWKRSSIFLQEILEKPGIFQVDVIVSPAQGKDMTEFIVDFSPYDVVVLDYNGDEWPEETKNNFVTYVKNGGGVVVYHASDNAFPEWQEYNEIIGLGGWGQRNEESGPYVYIENGEVVRDDSPGRGGSHGRQHEFKVQAFNPDHPVLKGLPEVWLHTKDELYSELRGPAQNLEILAYSHADEKYNGTGRNEPVLMTISYGEGRVFHTVLGHAGGELFAPAMECAGFVTTLQRGAEWAATGKVTQDLPPAFPTENETLRWEFFEDIHADLSNVIQGMKEYEVGKSNSSFNALQKLVRESMGNDEKLDEYHSVILKLLKSKDATIECKKILCWDFSWMANDSYREVYEELSKDENLAEAAQYALQRIEK